jgi:asparagine synthase (glutamine-hydrolysing)
MTALAGFWRFGGGSDVAANCARMLRGQGIYAREKPVEHGDGEMALGRAQWKLLAEDGHDRRPMVSADGRLVLVADARIDNREALCADLGIDAGAPFADAELILRAAVAWPDVFVGRLIGDFALALWDKTQSRLLLARDFLGQRPLHYHRGNGFFAFASMPKGLHALADVPYAPNASASADFMVLMPQAGPDTFFEGISRVEPGHVCIVDPAGLRSHPYWQPRLDPLSLGSDDQYAEALREKIDLAVARRLRGVGSEVGAHLSGGLDSSAVFSAAAIQMQARGGRVLAFTSVPARAAAVADRPGGFVDEGQLAALTARAYANAEHVTVTADERSPAAALDRHFFLYERPITNLANMGWWDAINDAAKARRLGVMLTGQAGNLSLSHAGADWLPHLFATGHWLKLARLAAGLHRHGWSAARIAGTLAGPYLPRQGWDLLLKLFKRTPQDLIADSCINPELEPLLQSRARERGYDPRLSPRKGSAELRLATLRRYDPGNHNKGMLAGWGLDLRDPTADRELVEFCLRVPAEQFILGGVPRSLARRALRGRVPEPVLAETRKGLQAADWYVALGRSREEVEAELRRIADCAPASGIVDTGRLASLVDNWPEGGWHNPAVERAYRSALLRAVSAGHFVRKASGANS